MVDLGPRFAVANPFGIRLSGLVAKGVTRAYHLYAIPRGSNRVLVGLDYLTGMGLRRPVVSLGLVEPGRASFAESEHIPVDR